MFERRLKILLVVFALPATAVLLRLFQLQIVHAREYQAAADQILVRSRSRVHLFPCLRGDITDQSGKIKLAYDAPSWNICVLYPVIVQDADYIRTYARQRYTASDFETAEASLKHDIAASWQAISTFSRTPLSELDRVAQSIVQKVQLIKKVVSERQKIPTDVIEETIFHAVIEGLTHEQQVQARQALKAYDWIEVMADQTRTYAGGPAVGQLLGRLSEVSAEDIANDPHKDDPLFEFIRYRARDRRGSSGIEAMGERWLRGYRGLSREAIPGKVLAETIEPKNGKNLRLTIDLPLQQAVYDHLARAVKVTQSDIGGCAVLLDIPSREVLAMVSYPSHDPNITWKEWLTLAEDEFREPARFRATQKLYPPGSTVKPMVLASALADGKVSATTHVICEGHLLPAEPNKWRCTSAHSQIAPNGVVDPVYAIQHSCNIFFYKTGELLGSFELARWMSAFGLGRTASTGLPQESPGRLPENTNAGFARLAGIGQGEVDITPLQAANMIATIATGTYRPVSIWADDPTPRPSTTLDIPNDAWRLVREGMYRTVNELGGTAYHYGRLVDAGDFILMGKTGTAQTTRRAAERMFTCHFPDGTIKEEAAISRPAIQRKYPDAEITGGRPTRYSPPEGVDPTHAWFTGYLTSKKHYLDAHNGGDLHVAIAVVIEYGGHGGVTAAPVALQMIRSLLDRQSTSAPASPDRGRP